MKNLIILLLVVTLYVPSMAQNIEFKSNELYPEGLAYSKKSNTFYVSSIHYGKIGKVDWKGNYQEFIDDSELVTTLGMLADDKRDLLFVCVADPGVSVRTKGETQGKLSKLVVYSLSTGEKQYSIDLMALNADNNNFANDLAMDSKGNLYITNSFAPIIFKVNTKTKKAEVFATHDSWKGEGFNLNGIAYHKKGFILASQSNTGVLYRVNENDAKDIIKIKVDAIGGADGIILSNPNELIVISNSQKKIFRLATKDDWKTAEITETIESKTQFPTTGVKVKGKNYVLNAKLNEIFDPNTPNTSNYFIQQID